jgi:hypothetical protein
MAVTSRGGRKSQTQQRKTAKANKSKAKASIKATKSSVKAAKSNKPKTRVKPDGRKTQISKPKPGVKKKLRWSAPFNEQGNRYLQAIDIIKTNKAGKKVKTTINKVNDNKLVTTYDPNPNKEGRSVTRKVDPVTGKIKKITYTRTNPDGTKSRTEHTGKSLVTKAKNRIKKATTETKGLAGKHKRLVERRQERTKQGLKPSKKLNYQIGSNMTKLMTKIALNKNKNQGLS